MSYSHKKFNCEQAAKEAASLDINTGLADEYKRGSKRHITMSIEGWLRMALSEPSSFKP